MNSKNVLILSLIASVVCFTPECFAVKKRSTEDKEEKSKKMEPKSHGVIEIKNKQDLNALLKDNDLVVGKFHSPACPHCVQMGPIFEEIALKYPDVKFVSVSAFEKGDKVLFDDYMVESYPTFAFFKGGKIYFKQVGASSKKDFENNVKKLQGK